VTFPPYQLDLGAGRLLRGAKPIDIRPKAMAVLQYLSQRPGQLVTKEEILQAVWPDVFVEEAVLKVTIGEIRKALADQCHEPRFIETAHRRGYRFIGKIETGGGAAGSEEAAAQLEMPETRYAKSGDLNIAYQVLGDGPVDLVFVMGWVSHLEYFWTEPSFARFLRRLASFSRLILFDKRGTGLSDRVPLTQLPTLEQRMDDVRAVMDAAGSKRAVICGVSEGAAMSAMFAAAHPERTAALVMIGGYARRIHDTSYPWGPTEAQREEFLEEIRDHWGGPIGLEERAPSMAEDPDFRRWWATYLRMSASPAAAVALTRMNSQADIRSVLSNVRVPSLVLHRSGDRCLRVEEGRYIAERIPGARFVELPGDDHLPFVGDQDAVLDHVEDFLTGVTQPAGSDKVLAVVLSASFQTRFWNTEKRSFVERRLRKLITEEVERYDGRKFRSDRNRLLASFTGPARAIRCACTLAREAAQFDAEARFGLHIGECSIKRGTIEGPAVELARTIEAQAGAGEILVGAAIRDLVAGSGIQFVDAGSPDLLAIDRGLDSLRLQ
jgi:pimeloyl-ACP methyl ester carboxylesterase